MDFLTELEDLAVRAVKHDEEITTEQVKRWQEVFGYNATEARDKIQSHRLDLNRPKISEEQWELIRGDKEAEGYDKEAYEHTMQLWTVVTGAQPITSIDTDIFVFKLGGPLEDWSSLGFQGDIVQGWVEAVEDRRAESASFAKVNGSTKRAIEQWLVAQPGCD